MLLYHRQIEYGRTVETVEVTEEGTFVLGDTPEAYAGAVLTVEIVHAVVMTDVSGSVNVLRFSNPAPLNKDSVPSTGAIILDGEEQRPGSGHPRIWTFRKATGLPTQVEQRAMAVLAIMDSDGDSGTKL